MATVQVVLLLILDGWSRRPPNGDRLGTIVRIP